MTTKVVILNWNGEEFLWRFLPSVVATIPTDVDVVVADNGSTDGSERVVGEVNVILPTDRNGVE